MNPHIIRIWVMSIFIISQLLTVCSCKSRWDGHTLEATLLAQHVDLVQRTSLQAFKLVLSWVSWQHHCYCHIGSCGQKKQTLQSIDHTLSPDMRNGATLTFGGLVVDNETVYFPQAGCPLQHSSGICYIVDLKMCWRGRNYSQDRSYFLSHMSGKINA